MESKDIFFRNLSTAISKRFTSSISFSDRPKKEAVRNIVDRHFSDAPSRKKDGAIQAVAKEPKKIPRERAAQIEERVKQVVDPDIAIKRKIIAHLSEKVAHLERMLEKESMPAYDRERLREMISSKQREIDGMRAAL